MRSCVPSFFDELTKISEDLMTPAVTAESATVDGPPAAPWTRRKGYRRLANPMAREAPNLSKQASGILDFARAQRAAKIGLGKTQQLVGHASRKAFGAMPRPLQQVVTNPRLLDPSDPSGGMAARHLFRVFGG